MNDFIHVCVCIPFETDNRSVEERAEMLAKFYKLDKRLRFHFVEYVEDAQLRAARARADRQAVAARAPPLSSPLRAVLAQAEIILAVDLPGDIHLLAPRLRWVQSIGGGVAQLQACGLEKLDALLTSGAGLLADPIAEFVLARILSHWKRFPAITEQQRHRSWKPVFGRSLAGSTLGIVGYGAIGRAVAWRAKCLGMRVLATERTTPLDGSDTTVDQFYPRIRLEDLLAASDAVVVAAAETPKTLGMFNTARFQAMKSGSYFCNVARGSLVNEEALRHALESGHISGASIDVAVDEPLVPTNPLWHTKNLAISAHCSPSMERFYHAVWDLFFGNMSRYLTNVPLKNERPAGLQPHD